MLCVKVLSPNKPVASGIPTSCHPWKRNDASGQGIPLEHIFVTTSVCKLLAYAYVLICECRKCSKLWVIFWRELISQNMCCRFANLEMRHSIFMDNIVVSPLVMGVLHEMAIASFVTFLSEGFCQKSVSWENL
jgi:hypothetical protein